MILLHRSVRTRVVLTALSGRILLQDPPVRTVSVLPHRFIIAFVAVTLPQVNHPSTCLTSTARLYGENSQAICYMDSIAMRLRGEYHPMCRDYSFGCFEGRALVWDSRVESFRVYFRRGTYQLITQLCLLGDVVIASHACRQFVEAITDFLRRNILAAYNIQASVFPRSQLKTVYGNVVFILDDKPGRWSQSVRGMVTEVPGFTGTTCARDGALHYVMLSRPDLFPSYNRRNLREIIQAPLLRLAGCEAASTALRDLISRELRPVYRISMCRR
jgi:hypothetical protein